ncbi:MAG: N-acetylmuramoyl-L-alanine amidase [Coleofasciculaceae cyanobacterium]
MVGTIIVSPARAEQPLYVAYPPANHQTTAQQIFLIGSAPATGEVLVNGKAIARSSSGNFAPSFPLQLGENLFTLRYQNQELKIKVTRQSTAPVLPVGLAFAKDSLTPAVDIAKMPGELICFGAIAPPKATVSVKLGNQTIPLMARNQDVQLPPNSAILTQQEQPISQPLIGQYQGCTTAETPANLGNPQFQLTMNGQTTTQQGVGKVSILSPATLEVAEVISKEGVARTGPSTDYSRLTPLPKGTRATITGREGGWVRLDYGAWLKASEVQIIEGTVPPVSLIRSVRARKVEGATEIIFPLQVPVPVSVQQGNRTFTLTLYNTTAQTDTIRLDDDPVISRLDWQQLAPGKLQYTFNLKSLQQWGYSLRYEGTSLILSLRHPPISSRQRESVSSTLIYGSNIISGEVISSSKTPLAGIKILLDPGHGGPEDLGSVGPTGYPEKAVVLLVSKLVREQLVAKGATVYLTREEDIDLGLQERVDMIEKLQPNIAISLHYNALPDQGDAINTKGIGTFWYNTQSHSLAMFLHNYLVQELNRPSYGVFWNNLALTRPHTTPAVLLELGFMINPVEFEWITNPQEQQKLAVTLADGITQWFMTR